ncbi:MAG: hypothetical protein Kow0026_08420 [Oricola sp.]
MEEYDVTLAEMQGYFRYSIKADDAAQALRETAAIAVIGFGALLLGLYAIATQWDRIETALQLPGVV